MPSSCISSVIRADRLSLYRQMNLSVFNFLAKRSIKLVGVSTPSRRRPTSAVEKRDFDPCVPVDLSDCFFGTVDGPVGHQVAAVFCAIRKSKHDGLLTVSALQMLVVWMTVIQVRHGPVSRF